MNLFEGTAVPSIIVIIGYLVTVLTSGFVLRLVLRIVQKSPAEKPNQEKFDTGFIIGKCENIIILSLVLLNAYTALALIFTAKSIVRADDIKKDPRYYLGGTLVNFTYSLLMGLIIRFIIDLIQKLI